MRSRRLHPQSAEFGPLPVPSAPKPAASSPYRLNGNLTLRDLSFGYSPLEGPLIEKFDLDLVAGARVALVGASGSGKSTVGKLVTGLFEPWGGTICFDGVPIAEVPRPLLRNSLAVVNPTRLPQLPDVPTFAELGFKGVEASAQVGIVAPANTPADTVAALQKQVATAIQQPAIRQKLIDFGIEPVGSTPQQYAELIRTEVQRWHQLIREQKISLD